MRKVEGPEDVVLSGHRGPEGQGVVTKTGPNGDTTTCDYPGHRTKKFCPVRFTEQIPTTSISTSISSFRRKRNDRHVVFTHILPPLTSYLSRLLSRVTNSSPDDRTFLDVVNF